MQLSPQVVTLINDAITAACSVKMENMIIESDVIFARSPDEHVVLIHRHDNPLPCNSIGLSRINLFQSRVAIAKSQGITTVDAIPDPQNRFARSLTIKAPGTKIDFRCANPVTIGKVKRSINDPVACTVTMTPEVYKLLSSGGSAMATKQVTLIGDDNGIQLQLHDDNNDVLCYQLPIDQVENDNPLDFSNIYMLDRLLTLLRHDSKCKFSITNRGIIKVLVNNIDFYLLPKLDL